MDWNMGMSMRWSRASTLMERCCLVRPPGERPACGLGGAAGVASARRGAAFGSPAAADGRYQSQPRHHRHWLCILTRCPLHQR